MFQKVSILLQKAPNLGRFKKDLEKKKFYDNSWNPKG